jgi:thymidylate synthase
MGDGACAALTSGSATPTPFVGGDYRVDDYQYHRASGYTQHTDHSVGSDHHQTSSSSQEQGADGQAQAYMDAIVLTWLNRCLDMASRYADSGGVASGWLTVGVTTALIAWSGYTYWARRQRLRRRKGAVKLGCHRRNQDGDENNDKNSRKRDRANLSSSQQRLIALGEQVRRASWPFVAGIATLRSACGGGERQGSRDRLVDSTDSTDSNGDDTNECDYSLAAWGHLAGTRRGSGDRYPDDDGEAEEAAYSALVKAVLLAPVTRSGMMRLFGGHLRFDLSNEGRIPVLTTNEVHVRGVLIELLWALQGKTRSDDLEAQGIHTWKPVASKAFVRHRGLENELDEGDLGPIYGFQWRHWGCYYQGSQDDYEDMGIDQVSECLRLLRTDGMSTRIVLCSWNCTDLRRMTLVPNVIIAQFDVAMACEDDLVETAAPDTTPTPEPDSLVPTDGEGAASPIVAPFLGPVDEDHHDLDKDDSDEEQEDGSASGSSPNAARHENVGPRVAKRQGKLSCHVYIRSADMAVGLAANIVTYALLVRVLCQLTGYEPGELVVSLGAMHAHGAHRTGLERQIERSRTWSRRTSTCMTIAIILASCMPPSELDCGVVKD